MSRNCIFLFSCLSLCLVVPVTLSAQVILTIEKIDTTRYPTMKVHIVTEDGGNIRRDLNSSNYAVKEDGFVQTPLSYNCPQSNQGFSLALLIGTGSSMSQQNLDAAKSAANAVVSLFDQNIDEGTLLSYSTTISIDVFLTNDKVQLQNGVGSLIPTTGQNKMWDGIATAISEIKNNGSQNSKAVLVCSNGVDDASTNGISSVTALALQAGIKIYCVGTGATGVGAVNLQSIASNTGGRYWAGSSGNFEQTLVNLLRGTPDACILEYITNNSCRDGLSRLLHVDCTIGNQSGSVERSYTMKQDTNTYQSASFKVDTGSVKSGNVKIIPLELITPLANRRFYPARIVLSFDTSKMKLLGIDPTGTLSDSLSISVTNLATGALIDFSKVKVINGSGVFLNMNFQATSVTQATTVPITISSFTFNRGCLVPQIASGSLTILPKITAIGQTLAYPAQLFWDIVKKDYTPNPFTVSVVVRNTGEVPVTNVLGNLPLQNGLTFLSGSDESQSATPNALAPGQEAALRWEMKADLQLSQKTFSLPLSITTNEGANLNTILIITIPGSGAKLSMNCPPPQIIVENNDYKPNPFSLISIIDNRGGSDAALQATIVLPQGLSLENDQATKSLPAITPNGQKSVQWNVKAVKLPFQKTYNVTVIIQGANVKTDTCAVQVTTPALNIPGVFASCIQLPAISYNTVSKVYSPNPFKVETDVMNRGSAQSDSVSVSLTTPPEIRLLDQSVRVLNKLDPNVNQRVEWNVSIIQILCEAKTVQLRIDVYSKNVKVDSCLMDLAIPARTNTNPRIVSSSPAPFDTARVGASKQFSLQTSDAEDDTLHYSWKLNGAAVGSDAASLLQNFTTRGPARLVCAVTDGCASDSVAWNFFVEFPVSVGAVGSAISGFELMQNYPNPLVLNGNTSSATQISFVTPRGEHFVEIKLLDATGREIATVVSGLYQEGIHRVTFDPMKQGDRSYRTLPSGIYFYRMIAGQFQRTRSMFIVQ